MRKNLNFIPLNNDLNKLSAFIPSLDSGWRANQQIKSKPFMVESLDAIREFQRQGWNIAGALENRSKKSRKVDNHFIKMEHPDFKILNKKGQTEAVATMNIQNSCNGSKPMELDLGAYRLVCSNGAVAHTSYSNAKVPHSEKGQYDLQEILCDLGIRTQGVMEEFNKLKESELTPAEAISMATRAANIRFGKDVNFDVSQLLNIVRDEDKGDDVWTVFNRIQENLTQAHRITDENGAMYGAVTDSREDTRINKELFQLAHAYA
jgi:hypothetical protein